MANESGAGVTRVSPDHHLPIANAILTVENEAQAWARAEEKGRDAARVAVEMANLLEDPVVSETSANTPAKKPRDHVAAPPRHRARARGRAARPVRVADRRRRCRRDRRPHARAGRLRPADAAHFDALLHGCIAEAADLDAVLTKHVDRKTTELSPIEHGVLMIGAYELKHCVDVPYKVAINEAVRLAKNFGGTDGHKYVNGVLDKAAADLCARWRCRRGSCAALSGMLRNWPRGSTTSSPST